MKQGAIIVLGLIGSVIACTASAQLPGLGDILKGTGNLPKATTTGSGADAPDEQTSGAEIMEALAVGTEHAVKSLSGVNGYFGNAAVKILMPSSMQKSTAVTRTVRFQKQVDDFILCMNRAAVPAPHCCAVGARIAALVESFADPGGAATTDPFWPHTSIGAQTWLHG